MQENKNTEDNKKCIKNEQNIPINNLKSYNLIFNKGCVNVEGFKKYNNEYDNFEIIDNAVKYIKQSDNLDKEKHLNRVKATKAECQINFNDSSSSTSLTLYLTTLISLINLFNSFNGIIMAKEFRLSGLFINPFNFYSYFSGSIKEPKDVDNSLISFLTFATILMAIIVFRNFTINIKKSSKYKNELKYLTYLEEQLESDK